MKKKLLTLACSLIVGLYSFGQTYNTDSIINLMQGEWILIGYSGGFCAPGVCDDVHVEYKDDSQNVKFDKHPSAKDSVRYSFYSDDKLITGYSKVDYADPTDITISGNRGWYIENWPEPFFGDSKRFFRVNDSSLVIDADDRIADAPSKKYKRKTAVSIDVVNCEGTYIHQFSTPQPSDSVKWELASGEAAFTSGVGYLSITESKDSTVMLMKVYNNGKFASTSYVINLPDTCDKQNQPRLKFNIDNCDGSYTYQYDLGSRDSVKWELYSGSAEFTQVGGYLTITKATDGTVFKQLNYYRLNTVPEYYEVNLPDTCDNQNPTEIISHDTISVKKCDFPYTHDLVTPAILKTITYEVESGYADFTNNGGLVIKDATDGTILVEKITYDNEPLKVYVTKYLMDVDSCIPTSLKFNSNNCDGSYTYQYDLGSRDSVKWELYSGSAEFTQVGGYLTITKATEGTVFKQLNYYSFNPNPIIEYYTVYLPENCNENPYTVSGQVNANGEVWNYVVVFLHNKTNDMAVDSVKSYNGEYEFTKVTEGTYTLYAKPYTDSTLTTLAKDYATTYYVNKTSLEEANTFEVTADTRGVDIRMIARTTSTVNDFNTAESLAYPNPFASELTIQINEVANGSRVRVSNVQGITIYNGVLNQSTTLNTSNWSSGVYFVEVQTGKGVSTHTVIK